MALAIAKGGPATPTNILGAGSVNTVTAARNGQLNVSATAFLAAGTFVGAYVNAQDDSSSSISFSISGSESSEYNFSIARIG